MADKYRKVAKSKDTTVRDEAEIRVTAVGSVSTYVTRAAKVYNDLQKPEVTITGTGNAITKAVQLAEVVKRRFKGLHQITKLSSQEIVDEYEPLEEGLDKVTDARNVSVVEIKLSKTALDTADKGYQPPIDESEVREYSEEEMTRGRGRGRGRGKGKAKGKGKSPKGKGKGKSPKGKGKDSSPKGKGKGKGKDSSPKGKGKSKGKSEDSPKGKGKGKGKSKGKDESPKGKGNKGKGYYDEPRGKGKSKAKGNDYWDRSKGYDRGYGRSDDYYPPVRGSSGGKSSSSWNTDYWRDYSNSKSKSKGWSSSYY